MGFYPQPDDWSCGPFALKHALVAMGRIVDEDDIAALAQTRWWSGTDELRLTRAAKAYQCRLPHERSRDPNRARKLLVDHVRKRVPVLLCVDDWEHWITVLRARDGQFVIVDSNLDPVLDVIGWPALRRRWHYLDTDYDEDDPPELYDLYPVVPRYRVHTRADFSIARIRHLRRPENRRLSEHWDEYLADLLEICRPRSAQMRNPLSMGELLRRNQQLIVRRTTYWHGDVEPAFVTRLLRDYRFVAETYGLVIPASARRRAVADLAILATLWVTAARGMGPLYGVGEG